MKFGKVILAAAVVGLGFWGASVASADSVNLSTGAVAWNVNYVHGNGSPQADSNYGTAQLIQAHSAWIGGRSIEDQGAKWIGPTLDSNPNGFYGDYYYTTTFTPETNNPYKFEGIFSSDNYVKEFQIDGVRQTTATPLSSSPTDRERDYARNFAISAILGKGAPHTLTFVVHNSSSNDQGDNVNFPADSRSNPTGFIMSATVTAVPLPGAAWMGLVLLGGLGAFQIAKRKLQVNSL